MTTPSETEIAALGESGPLLRFAAEQIKDLNPDFSRTIAEARDAAEKNEWTPQTSQSFWDAFNKLCDLIRPTTMADIAAAHRNFDKPWPIRTWSPSKISLAQRSSNRYLAALIVALVIILPIQLFAWASTNLSKKIDELIAADRVKLAQLVEDYGRLNSSIASKKQSDVVYYIPDPDDNKEAFRIARNAIALNSDVDRIAYQLSVLATASSFLMTRAYIPIYPATSETWWSLLYEDAAARFNVIQGIARDIQEGASLLTGLFVSFVLPILFGTIGAIAYVARAISDQIARTTFSTNTPTRHIMRVALGSLAGAVVGLFSGLTSQLSLSPLAIAFLAGYGVEALFSMFDGLVDKFRQERTTASAAMYDGSGRVTAAGEAR